MRPLQSTTVRGWSCFPRLGHGNLLWFLIQSAVDTNTYWVVYSSMSHSTYTICISYKSSCWCWKKISLTWISHCLLDHFNHTSEIFSEFLPCRCPEWNSRWCQSQRQSRNDDWILGFPDSNECGNYFRVGGITHRASLGLTFRLSHNLFQMSGCISLVHILSRVVWGCSAFWSSMIARLISTASEVAS